MLVTKNPHRMTMEENIRWLMESHPDLDERVFDSNAVMLPELRDKLMFRAHVLIDGCLKNYPWLRVDDIILFGSAVTYEYQEFSDLDLLVKVSLAKETSLLSSQEAFTYFIRKIHYNFLRKVGRFRLNGRAVEVKPVFSILSHLAQYSVLNNQWIKRPEHKDMADVNPQEVVNRAKAVLEQMKYMANEKYDRPNGKFDMKDIRELIDFYNQVWRLYHSTSEDWLVCKLVNYTGQLHRFNAFYTNQIAKTLSF